MRRVEALSQAQATLAKRYGDRLQIVQGHYNDEPFLHLSSTSFTQGLAFVSAVYVIVTVTDDDQFFQFSLVSCHGKNLEDFKVELDPESLEDTKLGFLEELASDNVHVCQGVQDMKERLWRQYLHRSKLPLLDKVKSTFFIEPLEEDVVLRSRSCQFVVFSPVRNNDPEATDFVRCQNCAVYQRQRKMTLFTHRRLKQEDAASCDAAKFLEEEEPLNNWQKVEGDYADNEFAQSSEHFQEFEEDKKLEMKEFLKDIGDRGRNYKSTFEDFKPEVLPEVTVDESSGSVKKLERKSKVAAKVLTSEKLKPDSQPEEWEDLEPESMDADYEPMEGEEAFEEEEDDVGLDPDVTPKSLKHSNKKGMLIKSFFQDCFDFVEIYLKARGEVEALDKNTHKSFKHKSLRSGGKFVYRCTVCLRATFDRNRAVKCIEKHKEVVDLSERVPCPECLMPVERGLVSPHFEKAHPGHISCFHCLLKMPQMARSNLEIIGKKDWDSICKRNNHLR